MLVSRLLLTFSYNVVALFHIDPILDAADDVRDDDTEEEDDDDVVEDKDDEDEDVFGIAVTIVLLLFDRIGFFL